MESGLLSELLILPSTRDSVLKTVLSNTDVFS